MFLSTIFDSSLPHPGPKSTNRNEVIGHPWLNRGQFDADNLVLAQARNGELYTWTYHFLMGGYCIAMALAELMC